MVVVVVVDFVDIVAYPELDQLIEMDLFDFAPYPNVQAWMQRMQVCIISQPIRERVRESGVCVSEC
jgi:glutathione S-transferase